VIMHPTLSFPIGVVERNYFCEAAELVIRVGVDCRGRLVSLVTAQTGLFARKYCELAHADDARTGKNGAGTQDSQTRSFSNLTWDTHRNVFDRDTEFRLGMDG